MNRLMTILVALALSSLCASAATIRVPADQPTIQAGIDAARDGDTVLLADGHYTGVGNRLISPLGKAITIRSDNGPGACVIDAESDLYHDYNTFNIDSGETRMTVISGFTIRGGDPAGIFISESSPTIRDCVIDNRGAGIRLREISNEVGALIESCQISSNGEFGIRSWRGGATVIADCLISDNYDSGIHLWSGRIEILNCHISGNSAEYDGGGIYCGYSSPDIRNCTIVGNSANGDGGGINSSSYSNPTVENCIIADNSATTGDQISLSLDLYGDSTELTISYSDVFGEINVDPRCDLIIGPGLIDEDPLFTEGPEGNHYLSQTAAGQAVTSPCADTGNPESWRIDGTTRTDSVADSGVMDMGFHYELDIDDGLPDTRILSGPENWSWPSSPVVVFTFTGEADSFPVSELSYSWRFDNDPWSEWSPRTWAAIDGMDGTGELIVFEVRVRDPEGNIDLTPAIRWFRNDSSSTFGVDNVVAGPGPGPGNPPLVRTSQGQWTAYTVMNYGVNLAAGDIDGDGADEVITGPGPGHSFGPHVRCFEADGAVIQNAGFMAYGTHRHGVNVAAGDVDGDGFDEIITGAGPGAVFGPHVRGWNWDGGPDLLPIPGISFFAYGTLKYGVNVACGDLNGDGIDEIITGAGPGAVFGPHVRGWRFDGGTITPMSDVNFFAYSTLLWGVNVACGDLDGDGRDEIITGAGPGPFFTPHVRTWNYSGTRPAPLPEHSYFAYPFGTYGVVVGSADTDADGNDEIITMPGPGLSNKAWLRTWNIGTHVGRDEDFIAFDHWMTHGGSVAGSKNGWTWGGRPAGCRSGSSPCR